MAFSANDVNLNTEALQGSIVMLSNVPQDAAGNYSIQDKKIINCSAICASGASAGDYISFNKTGNGIITLNRDTIIQGSLTSITAANLEIADNSIKICDGNTISDIIDGTFYMEHKTGGTQYYSGISRDATDDTWKIFKTESEPTTTVYFSDPSLTYGDLSVKQLNCSSKIRNSDGVVGAPSYSFTNSVDTGFYRTKHSGNITDIALRGAWWLTITTSAPHELQSGSKITLSNCFYPVNDGEYLVLGAPSPITLSVDKRPGGHAEGAFATYTHNSISYSQNGTNAFQFHDGLTIKTGTLDILGKSTPFIALRGDSSDPGSKVMYFKMKADESACQIQGRCYALRNSGRGRKCAFRI